MSLIHGLSEVVVERLWRCLSIIVIFAAVLVSSRSKVSSAMAGGVVRPYNSSSSKVADGGDGQMLFLVPTPAPALSYHGGEILKGESAEVNILWYGGFSEAEKGAISDFIASFSGPGDDNDDDAGSSPTVHSWWAKGIASSYKDAGGAAAVASFKLGTQASDPSCSLMGKNLAEADLAALVSKAFSIGGDLPPPKSSSSTNAISIYAVFTAQDVVVEGFCMSSCGTHSFAVREASSSSSSSSSSSPPAMVPFLWVGNPATQCPGLCAWPYAVPEFGPPRPALSPPNGLPSTDGIIINLALLLAGTATNPFGNGFFEGPSSNPLEAGTSCQGIYGPGSFSGFPGHLLQDKDSGASFNAFGSDGRRFLLPALWNPSTHTCQPPL